MKLKGLVHAVVVLSFFLSLSALGAEEWTAACEEIVDGDSIIVDHDGDRIAVRLGGIDAPEIGQAFGQDAQEYLEELVLGKQVIVHPLGELEGETAARVRVGDLDLSQELLTAGLAWHDTEHNNDEKLVLAMIVARGAAKGLWSAAEPMQPSEWRRLNTPKDQPNTHKNKAKRLSNVAEDVSLNREIEDGDGVIRIAGGSSPEADASSSTSGNRESDDSGDPCLRRIKSRATSYAEKKACSLVYGIDSATKVRGTTYRVQGRCQDSETGNVRTFKIVYYCSAKNLPGQILVSGSDKPIKKSVESAAMGFKFID